MLVLQHKDKAGIAYSSACILKKHNAGIWSLMTTSPTVFWRNRAFNLLLQLFHGPMLNLIFLSLNLFSPLFPSPLHKQWPDSSTQAPAIYSKAIREMLCPKRTTCPSTLCSPKGCKFCKASTSQKRNDRSWAGVPAMTKQHFVSASAPVLLR